MTDVVHLLIIYIYASYFTALHTFHSDSFQVMKKSHINGCNNILKMYSICKIHRAAVGFISNMKRCYSLGCCGGLDI